MTLIVVVIVAVIVTRAIPARVGDSECFFWGSPISDTLRASTLAKWGGAVWVGSEGRVDGSAAGREWTGGNAEGAAVGTGNVLGVAVGSYNDVAMWAGVGRWRSGVGRLLVGRSHRRSHGA